MAATLSLSPSTRMLKDFLQETNGNVKSKTASFTSLAIHAVVAAVKRISFPSVKSPRSLLRKRERDEREIGGDFVVKVKDIIRWRSFRDLVDDTAETAAPPLDFADSPDRYTAAATTATTTTANSSNSSSWCESDFTAEDLTSPSWSGCADGGEGKMYFSCVSEDSIKAMNSENDRKVNEISMHDNKEEQDVLDGRARELLKHVKDTTLLSESREMVEYCPLDEHVKDTMLLAESRKMVEHCPLDWFSLQFIQQEVTYFQKSEDEMKQVNDIENIIKNTKEDENDYEWILSQKGKEAYVREMERDGKWRVYGNEKVELGLEIEGGILDYLVDEILLDIFQL